MTRTCRVRDTDSTHYRSTNIRTPYRVQQLERLSHQIFPRPSDKHKLPNWSGPWQRYVRLRKGSRDQFNLERRIEEVPFLYRPEKDVGILCRDQKAGLTWRRWREEKQILAEESIRRQ